ncbi:MAG: GntR family transcriptional regulator, partial [Oscillospiraceae bacterium]|nr:GntR family transcriptional regulator [Oscillospiraceae bacterium]
RKQESAAARVYEQLLRWITDGTLVPGEKLNEAEIAAWFSVSRTPVHEAMLLLAKERFTEIYPARGSFVSRISLPECDAVYEAISGVSSCVGQLACEKRTERDIAALRELNAAFTDALTCGKETARILEADRRFHAAVAKLAGNPFLLAYHEQLQAHVYRFEYILSAIGIRRDASVAAHDALIEAIWRRDPAAAETAANRNWLDCHRAQRNALWDYVVQKGWDQCQA